LRLRVTVVQLSWSELRYGAQAGVDRHVRALSSVRTETFGAQRDDWNAHIIGALGELAFAKARGSYWCPDLGRPDRGAADVDGFHVRTRAHATDDLALHRSDDDAGVFVLVVLDGLPTFRIVGTCTGAEGKRDEWWCPTRPVFFVPQAQLTPWQDA